MSEPVKLILIGAIVFFSFGALFLVTDGEASFKKSRAILLISLLGLLAMPIGSIWWVVIQ